MMRRPDQLAGMSNSLGRRLIEPESFVSSSCVGEQFQNRLRHPIEKVASARPAARRATFELSGMLRARTARGSRKLSQPVWITTWGEAAYCSKRGPSNARLVFSCPGIHTVLI